MTDARRPRLRPARRALPARMRLPPARGRRRCRGRGCRRRAAARRLGACGGPASLGVATQVAYAGAGVHRRHLVVLVLRGGFDGLSAVAPVGDPDYYAARPTHRRSRTSRLIQLDAGSACTRRWRRSSRSTTPGSSRAVHAVGQPNPTRSHFDRDGRDGARGARARRCAPAGSTGWSALRRRADPFAATPMGSTTAPRSFLGPSPELAMRLGRHASALGAGTTTADGPAGDRAARRCTPARPTVAGGAGAGDARRALATTATLKARRLHPGERRGLPRRRPRRRAARRRPADQGRRRPAGRGRRLRRLGHARRPGPQSTAAGCSTS